MPRPKTTYLHHSHLFNGVKVINEKDLMEDNKFNVNTKVIIECDNKHTYCSSVTKVKSLHKNPKECPHCSLRAKYEQMGVKYEVIFSWATKYNFKIMNEKQYYNRFNDSIFVKCNVHDYIKEIKSISHLEKNLDNTTLQCPECNGKYHPISADVIKEKLNTRDNLSNGVILRETITYDTLPQNLKNKILTQDKWRIVQYTNTKTKCVYQCNDCGEIKECLPYNLFTGNGNGCLGCKKNIDADRVCEKIKNMCLEYNFYPKTKLEYKDVNTPIEFVCNNCGGLYVKTWANLTGNYYKMSCEKCYASTKRKSQTEFCEFIKSLVLDVEENNKTIIAPYELDIVCHDKKVAFEFCGVIWHSTKFKNDKNYHKRKYEMCKENGYRLITIFDDEWCNKKDICKSRIISILGKNENKIYARKCKIIEVDDFTARDFFNNNHIQGAPSKIGNCYGLEHNGSIVCMMSFGLRHGKLKRVENQWELQRYSTIRELNVPGGAGKLLNNFIKLHPMTQIVTFSDNRWGDSEFYKKIGFLEDKILGVDYMYCGSNTKWCRKHKFGFDKKKLIKKCLSLNIDFTEYDTEAVLSEKLGLYRVYDCGHKRYIIENK